MPIEPLSAIDVAWLRMEDASHPMMITVALAFGPPLDRERLRTMLAHRLLGFRRFRQRAVQPKQPSGRPYWDEDAGVDWDYHLPSVSLRPPGDEAALQDVISELMSKQLDLAKPLWQFHLVEGYGEGWVLVGRVHHCLADGPALVHVLHALADGAGDRQRNVALLEDTVQPGQRLPGLAGQLAEMLVREGSDLLRNPARLLGLARLGRGGLASLRKLVMRPDDPATVLKGSLGVAKRVAWSEPVSLEAIRSIGDWVGGTVNDVMLAAGAGALRRYLQVRGEPVDALSIRVGLSVGLHSAGDRRRLGNQAGAVLVELPIGVADPSDRLAVVKREMDALKRSPEGFLVRRLLSAMGQAPADTQAALVEAYCTRDTAVMSNVPGPRQRIHVVGAPLETLLFWVPAFGRVGLGLNIISYAGQIRLSVATDRGLVPDPETIVEAFQDEVEALQALVGQQDGERIGDGNAFQKMSVMLDQALARLDALLADEETSNPQQEG